MGRQITPQDITTRIPVARADVAGAIYRTPLERSIWLSEATGADVSLKLDAFQPTGSFKVRGAVAAISHLSPDERNRGVVTASAGNHGLGVAYAASRAGVRATIVVPETASPAKVAALQRFPIELLNAVDYDASEQRALQIAQDTGAVFVSPYNDPWVIAGQGTIGVEMLDDEPGLDVVLVQIGGGGLISGIAAWLKAIKPDARVIGIEPVAAPAMREAMQAGRLVQVAIAPTLADGLAGNIQEGSITFDLVRDLVDEIVLVSEEEIGSAVRASFHELHLALEGSGVAGIAALLSGRISGLKGKRVASVVSGRNIAAERLCTLLGA